MKLMPYKATDKELGKIRKDLQEILAVWANQWNMRTLEELPDYVQDMYIAFCYSLWLEDQVANLKVEDKEEADEILDRSGTDSKTSDDGSGGDADKDTDKGRTTVESSVSEHQHGEQHPSPNDREGADSVQSDNKGVLNQPELGVHPDEAHPVVGE